MISVIIPYKDSEAWIERCADSCTDNDGDFEFIFVNDNSKDDGEKLLEKYKDNRFKFIRNYRANGVSGARNSGMNCANGEWISFLDADDELLPNSYHTYTEAIGAGKDPLIQLNHLRYYTAIKKQVLKYDNSGGRYTVSNFPQQWFGVWNKILRRDLADKVRFKEGMQYGEDGLFVLECISRTGYIQHASRYLTAVRHRFDNKHSLSHSKTTRDLIAQTRAYEDFLLEQTDVALQLRVCKELSTLWGSKIYESVLVENANGAG